MNPDWLVPQWPVPANVHAACTTRAGGTSAAPYDALNLGDHVGDHPVNVGRNRAILYEAIAAKPVFLTQVHGTRTVLLTGKTPQGTEADACVASEPGLACTIMVADCLPVLFTHDEGTWVAAAHAGWRGLAGIDGQGVLESVIQSFKALALVNSAQDASKIIAWLGPCIGPDAFEVGAEVKAAFEWHDHQAVQLFKPLPHGKWLADLQGLARLRLQAMGISRIYGNDGSPPWCTVGNPSRFFSHRRDRVSGRMAACIWRD